MCAEGSWLAIQVQTTGIYRETNHGKCAKRLETAAAAVIYYDLLSIVFFKTKVEIRKTDLSSN